MLYTVIEDFFWSRGLIYDLFYYNVNYECIDLHVFFRRGSINFVEGAFHAIKYRNKNIATIHFLTLRRGYVFPWDWFFIRTKQKSDIKNWSFFFIIWPIVLVENCRIGLFISCRSVYIFYKIWRPKFFQKKIYTTKSLHHKLNDRPP